MIAGWTDTGNGGGAGCLKRPRVEHERQGMQGQTGS